LSAESYFFFAISSTAIFHFIADFRQRPFHFIDIFILRGALPLIARVIDIIADAFGDAELIVITYLCHLSFVSCRGFFSLRRFPSFAPQHAMMIRRLLTPPRCHIAVRADARDTASSSLKGARRAT